MKQILALARRRNLTKHAVEFLWLVVFFGLFQIAFILDELATCYPYCN